MNESTDLIFSLNEPILSLALPLDKHFIFMLYILSVFIHMIDYFIIPNFEHLGLHIVLI